MLKASQRNELPQLRSGTMVAHFFFDPGRSCLKTRNPTTSREPAPANCRRIRIGDVGIVHRGKFYLLFSAGRPLGKRQLGVDVPITFEELTVGRTTLSQPRPAGCIQTFQEFGVGPSVSVSTPPCVLSISQSFAYLRNMPPRPPKPGVPFSFNLTGNRGAALLTRYPTYREDARSESGFEKYTKLHYESWVAFAIHKGCKGNVRPVLVVGFDMTRDFAMVAYSNMGDHLESDPPLALLMPTPTSPSAWGTWCTSRPCDTNCGPRQCDLPPDKQTTDLPPGDPRGIPNGFNQCIFIRYCSAHQRIRLPRFPIVLKADGPRNSGPSDNRGGTFPESTMRSGAEPTTSGNENLGRQQGPITDKAGLSKVIHFPV